MTRKSHAVKELDRTMLELAKATPAKVYPLLHRAFLVFAAAGELEHAGALIRLAYDARLPRPSAVVDVFGTGPMDAVCAVGGLGDVTGGAPAARHLVAADGLADRVRLSEGLVRSRIVRDSYSQLARPAGDWRALEGLDLWRTIQHLAVTATEDATFEALSKYMDAWCASPADRGAGYGDEVVLAIDLAVRQDATRPLERWIPAVGRHLVNGKITQALCLRSVVGAAGSGLLAPLLGMPADAELRLHAIEEAVARLGATSGAPDDEGATTSARRRVSAFYGQFSLEHETSPGDEVFFQDERESAQGMSMFGSKVGIGTPSDTATCTVAIELRGDRPHADLGDAIQAVAFPFTVTGPIFVRSVIGDDEDDGVVLPHGAYDVLARFLPARGSRSNAEAGLREFHVALDFHPPGSLGAPRCLKLDGGAPPTTIFVRGR